MVAHLKINPSSRRPGRLELHLERDVLTWNDTLIGRLIITAGPDGLSLMDVKIEPDPSGSLDISGGKTGGSNPAYWPRVQVGPREKSWLDFKLIVPAECAMRAGGELVVQALLTPAPEWLDLRLPFRVVPPSVYVRVGEWFSGHTGLAVARIRPDETGNGARITLDPPEGGQAFLDGMELQVVRDPLRVFVRATLTPRRRGVERLRWLVGSQPGTAFNVSMLEADLDEALPALDAALRPFLSPSRDLPLPSAENPAPESAQFPVPASTSIVDDRSLPRTASEPETQS